MIEVTMEQVLKALRQTLEGRTQLELATQRAIIEAQRREIEVLSNGHDPAMTTTVGGDDG